MIPLLWAAAALLGAGGVMIALSGEKKITDAEIQKAFCDAQAEGVESPTELQYVVAKVLMPEHSWPPPPDAPADQHQAWDRLGHVANLVGEGGMQCP